MTVTSCAKINLGLQVVARRPDGFHDIDTVFHRVNINDVIDFRRTASGITLRSNLKFIPTDERNLCVRAAMLLFAHCGYREGLDITLEKTVPVGAGLGGGSANAAAVLRALPTMLQLEVDEMALHGMALSLGSDVPYFLNEGSAHATGRGDVLSYFPLALPYWIVVVHPGEHVSTPWAYRNLLLDPVRRIIDLRSVFEEHAGEPAVLREFVRNDFEPLVLDAYPAIKNVRDSLRDLGADLALMSGSGSSVFGLFSSEDAARAAHDRFSSVYRSFLTPMGYKHCGTNRSEG